MTLSRAYEQEISDKKQTQLGSRTYTYLLYNSPRLSRLFSGKTLGSKLCLPFFLAHPRHL